MHTLDLDIRVELSDGEPVAFAAHAHSLAVRLACRRGLICTRASMDVGNRTFHGRYLADRRRAPQLRADLDRLLAAEPGVILASVAGGASETAGPASSDRARRLTATASPVLTWA